MTTRTLPDSPSVENLKKQARSLLKQVNAGEATGLARVKPYLASDDTPRLQLMQLVLAREYGFSSWSALLTHIKDTSEARNHFADGFSDDTDASARHDEFLRLAVLVYDAPYGPDPARFNKARALLDEHPELRHHSLHAACVAGDVGRVRRWLVESPAQIDAPGGSLAWSPLLYASYARLPGVSTLEVGRCLLAAGADPNTHFIANGQYRFTALTGVFGRGEAGPVAQPEHPEAESFARLLLEAGADPNDSQAAYNRMFLSDNTCLALLLEYGLGAGDRNNWPLLDGGEAMPHPDSTLAYQMAWAVRHGMLARVQLLLEHGVSANTQQAGRSALEHALLGGHESVADVLMQHGATPVELPPVDRFRQACLSADRTRALRMLDADSDLLQSVMQAHPSLLHEAAGADQRDAAQLMIDLGWDVNRQIDNVPLHAAAWQGHLAMVMLLVDNGADTTRRDTRYFSPPLGHALFNGQQAVVDYLETCAVDIFTAAARGLVAGIDDHLAQDPTRLDQRFADCRPVSEHPCTMDWMTPLAMAVLNNQPAAVACLLSYSARLDISNDDGVSLMVMAREHADDAVSSLLQAASR